MHAITVNRCFSLVLYMHSEEVVDFGGISFTRKMRLLEVVATSVQGSLHSGRPVPALAPYVALSVNRSGVSIFGGYRKLKSGECKYGRKLGNYKEENDVASSSSTARKTSGNGNDNWRSCYCKLAGERMLVREWNRYEV